MCTSLPIATICGWYLRSGLAIVVLRLTLVQLVPFQVTYQRSGLWFTATMRGISSPGMRTLATSLEVIAPIWPSGGKTPGVLVSSLVLVVTFGVGATAS